VTAGVTITAVLASLLVVGVLVRHPHRHRAAWSAVRVADHVGSWEVCRCGAARMCGDRRWHRHPPAGFSFLRTVKG
jgi:hypothetical protein